MTKIIEKSHEVVQVGNSLDSVSSSHAADVKQNRIVMLTSWSAIALGLSACGGGGGSTSNQTQQSGSSNVTQQSSTTPVALPPSGTLLSLSKVGGEYVSTNVQGFTLQDNNAHYIVANDKSDNSYELKVSATGAGTLEFEFEDANDLVIMMDGSVISGFNQLNVKNGSLDVTEADIGDVDTIVVASSIKLTFQQVKSVDSLVSNSSDSSFEITVASDAEAAALQELISSGTLEIFGSEGAINVVTETPSTPVTPTLVTSVVATAAGAVAAAAAPPPAVIAPQVVETLLGQKSAVTAYIQNADTYVNASEAASPVKFRVDVADGYNIKSVKLSGVELSKTGSLGEYTASASQFAQGSHTLTVTVQDELLAQAGSDIFGGTVVLESEIIIDTIAPEAASVIISGEANGLNQLEASSDVAVLINSSTGSDVISASVNGNSLTKVVGNLYSMDASTFADGDYAIVVNQADAAGNTSTSQKSFAVARTGPNEAIVTIGGDGDRGLNATEASGLVDLKVDLNGEARVISATGPDGATLTETSTLTYQFDAATLTEGAHTVSVVTEAGDGSATTSVHAFFVDRTPPSDADINITGASFGLTPAELVDPVPVFVAADAGSSIASVSLDGRVISTSGVGIYSLSGGTLSPGLHDLAVTTEDLVGNTKITTESFTVLGQTGSAADIFEITSNRSSGTIDFEVRVKNVLSSLSEGINVYDFDMQFDTGQLDYVEGSFIGFEGSLFAVGESSSASGLVRVAGASRSAFESYDAPFMTFSARDLGASDTSSITLGSLLLGDQSFGDVSYFMDI